MAFHPVRSLRPVRSLGYSRTLERSCSRRSPCFAPAASRTWRRSASPPRTSTCKRRGRHPELGPVTLEQLLATWVAHDLSHLGQIARVMGKGLHGRSGPVGGLPPHAGRERRLGLTGGAGVRTWARYGVILAGGFIAGNRAVDACRGRSPLARARRQRPVGGGTLPDDVLARCGGRRGERRARLPRLVAVATTGGCAASQPRRRGHLALTAVRLVTRRVLRCVISCSESPRSRRGRGPANPMPASPRLAWLAGCWELYRRRPRRRKRVDPSPRRPHARPEVRPDAAGGETRWSRRAGATPSRRGGRLAVTAPTHPARRPPSSRSTQPCPTRPSRSRTWGHDFPAARDVSASHPDSLVGRVEGMSRGKLRGVEFPYARVACP